MSFRKFFSFMVCAISIPDTALAQDSQRHPNYSIYDTALLHYLWAWDIFFLAIAAGGLIVTISGAWTDIIREKAAAGETQLHRQAQLMREMTAHQDIHTDMMRSEIDHTRTYGEYRELPEIAEHEQRIRELRNKLG